LPRQNAERAAHESRRGAEAFDEPNRIGGKVTELEIRSARSSVCPWRIIYQVTRANVFIAILITNGGSRRRSISRRASIRREENETAIRPVEAGAAPDLTHASLWYKASFECLLA